jgi:cell wall-associated NlpC family hydrolase
MSALIVMLTMSVVPAIAQSVDQRKSDAQKQVEALQAKLESAVERYNYACVKLENTRGQMAENKVKITQAEQQLAADRTRLNSRVRAMYVTRQVKMVDVVVSAKNIDEFLVGLDLAKKVSQRDAQMVRQVKDTKASLEQARSSLQQQKAEQEAATKEMSDSKAAVEGDLSGAKGKLANVEDEIRQAMARRAAQATSRTTSGTVSRYTPPSQRPTRPPGAPHGGVVGVAYDQLGKPYVWGAEGPDCFDCSGLTMYCYRVGAGISISHSSYAQAGCGASVGAGQLQPGDILGFRGWGHVGLYVGGDSFIHAPQTGDVVKVSSLSARTNFCGAVRP